VFIISLYWQVGNFGKENTEFFLGIPIYYEGAMNASHLLEDQDQTQLAHKIDDLQKQIAEVTQLLGFLAGRSPNCRCQPFICEGRVRFLVTADELSTFIPRSTATLIEWANAGRIPARRLPASGEKGPGPWMFDLPEVMRDLDGYRL
jgi:hypothetical protein